MATLQDFEELAEQHLNTAIILMTAKDWCGAAYMMGYVLEFTLKGEACKSLNFEYYPETHNSDKVVSFFKTHYFDQLIMISGVSNLFDTRGTPEAQQNWSDFTASYLGEWPTMRYNKDIRRQFDKTKVESLYYILTNDKDGIMKVIKDKK